LIYSLSIAILSLWLDFQTHQVTFFICHLGFRSTTSIWPICFDLALTKYKYFFFTLARSFGRQAVACPSPLLSTLKLFLAISTFSNHLVTLGVESHVVLAFSWIIEISQSNKPCMKYVCIVVLYLN
jgi:hypothetical protein